MKTFTELLQAYEKELQEGSEKYRKDEVSDLAWHVAKAQQITNGTVREMLEILVEKERKQNAN